MLLLESESSTVSDEIVLHTRSNYCCMGLLVLCVFGCVHGWCVCVGGGLGVVCVYVQCCESKQFPVGIFLNRKLVPQMPGRMLFLGLLIASLQKKAAVSGLTLPHL